MKSLTKDQQQMLALAVLVLGGFGYVFINQFWIPVSRRIKETSEKIENVKRELLKAQGRAGQLARLQDNMEALNEKTLEAERRLPRSRELPALLDTISELAQQNGVTIMSVNPLGEQKSQYFTNMPYQMTITGGYHGIAKFLTALAVSERIFNHQNLKLASKGSKESEAEVQADFALISYKYNN
ncbi:MAG: type 4a pilus biogenesis protein PilO [Elusimicrobia bacterium]|nr:type 4a pilus biogenesis protein PilO [Elusimicrobiota bacterium]